MSGANPQYVANATLTPSTIVIMVAGTDHRVTPASAATTPMVGVVHEGTRTGPIPGVTAEAAQAGESVRVYGDGEVCEVTAGATIAAGDKVTSNASAQAVPAVTTNYFVGTALTDAASGEKCSIQVQPGYFA